jgi:lincosamide nucleotidyltransferase
MASMMDRRALMLPQVEMIHRLRTLCQEDERLAAALLYGSFTRGVGDQFSDIECALFFRDECLAAVYQLAWVNQIAPVSLFFADDFGHYTAIFDNLVRGEFHFEPASAVAQVARWRGNAWFPLLDSAVLVDRTGELTSHLQGLLEPPPDRDTPEQVQHLAAHFLNSVLFGANVLARGERARALDLLNLTHRYLLWMVRLVEHSVDHWPTPSRSLEQDISSTAYERFVACTANLSACALRRAYRASWAWGCELLQELAVRHHRPLPDRLIERVDMHLLGIIHHESRLAHDV